MQTVLITGAGRGLGWEFARQYALDGWHVIGTCRTEQALKALGALGPQVESHKLDVTDENALRALASSLKDQAIDLLIANAGVMTARPNTPLSEIPQSAWLEAFRVNTIAPLKCAHAFLSQVARSKERKMVAMSSWIGSITSNQTGGHYVYRASKSALNAAWRSFAIDHPEVIAALLSPGPLRTDMTSYDAARWAQLPEPAENIGRLRSIIAKLSPADSGALFHFDGQRLPW